MSKNYSIQQQFIDPKYNSQKSLKARVLALALTEPMNSQERLK